MKDHFFHFCAFIASISQGIFRNSGDFRM